MNRWIGIFLNECDGFWSEIDASHTCNGADRGEQHLCPAPRHRTAPSSVFFHINTALICFKMNRTSSKRPFCKALNLICFLYVQARRPIVYPVQARTEENMVPCDPRSRVCCPKLWSCDLVRHAEMQSCIFTFKLLIIVCLSSVRRSARLALDSRRNACIVASARPYLQFFSTST